MRCSTNAVCSNLLSCGGFHGKSITKAPDVLVIYVNRFRDLIGKHTDEIEIEEEVMVPVKVCTAALSLIVSAKVHHSL